jgi:hypothetical protein
MTAAVRESVVIEALTGDESDRRAELETLIDRATRSFIEAGRALAEIRDGKLYRSTHGTFVDYLADRWQMSKPRGYQLIAAAETSTIVDVFSEGQARELGRVPAAKQAAIWQAVNEATGGKPTAKAIRQLVEYGTVNIDPPRASPRPPSERVFEAGHKLRQALETLLRLAEIEPASPKEGRAFVAALVPELEYAQAALTTIHSLIGE